MERWDSRDTNRERHLGKPGRPAYEPTVLGPPCSWADISGRAGRADKPELLVTAVGQGLLSGPGELRVALEDTWTSNEWPGRAATNDLWLILFQTALEPGTYLDETELRPLEALPERLHVYRAAAPGFEDGLSWTSEFEHAHWFATRLDSLSGRGHRIFEMDAPRESLLASFNRSRGENEYVIDTTIAPPEIRTEIHPEDWEDRLAGRTPGIGHSQPAGLIARKQNLTPGGPTPPDAPARVVEGVGRAEALGLLLRDTEESDAQGLLAAVEAVNALYPDTDVDARVARDAVDEVIARARQHVTDE